MMLLFKQNFLRDFIQKKQFNTSFDGQNGSYDFVLFYSAKIA